MSKELIKKLQRCPQNFRLLPAPGHAEFWKNVNVVARCTDYEESEDAGNNQSPSRSDVITGIVVCNIGKPALKYDCKTAGSSHIKRHTENCKPSQNKNEQTLLTSHFNKKEV